MSWSAPGDTMLNLGSKQSMPYVYTLPSSLSIPRMDVLNPGLLVDIEVDWLCEGLMWLGGDCKLMML